MSVLLCNVEWVLNSTIETKLVVNSDSDDEVTPRKRSKKADQLNKPKWQTSNAVR